MIDAPRRLRPDEVEHAQSRCYQCLASTPELYAVPSIGQDVALGLCATCGQKTYRSWLAVSAMAAVHQGNAAVLRVIADRIERHNARVVRAHGNTTL